MYDWTLDGRVRQFTDYLRQIQPGEADLLPLMRQAAQDWSLAVVPEEIGQVLTVDSEIATVGGLDHAGPRWAPGRCAAPPSGGL